MLRRTLTSALLAAAATRPRPSEASGPVAVVRWVYPERQKAPFIGEAPNSAGLFDSLFQRIASSAGFTLAVDRVPKARAWRQLELGASDFYPGASFSVERSRHVVWIDTGLRTREVCLLRPGLTLQTSLADAKGLVLGVEPGSSKVEQFPQHRHQTLGSRLTVERAVDLLVRNRVDVVVVDIEPLSAYVAQGEPGRLARLGVGVDEQCIGPWLPLQLAWSRAALQAEGVTALPRPAQQPGDQSDQLPRGCKAARFQAALAQLKARGGLARLAAQYDVEPPS